MVRIEVIATSKGRLHVENGRQRSNLIKYTSTPSNNSQLIRTVVGVSAKAYQTTIKNPQRKYIYTKEIINLQWQNLKHFKLQNAGDVSSAYSTKQPALNVSQPAASDVRGS